jgi:hypothetical protein
MTVLDEDDSPAFPPKVEREPLVIDCSINQGEQDKVVVVGVYEDSDGNKANVYLRGADPGGGRDFVSTDDWTFATREQAMAVARVLATAFNLEIDEY